LLDGCQRGDLVKARLVVTDTDAWLSRLERTGHAEVAAQAADEAPTDPLLGPGDQVPDARLVAADGQAFAFSSLRGRVVALTFIYTRCPLPQFCPLMDRQFQEVQRRVQADGRLRQEVALLSISFDPEYDTEAVLAAHARRVGADGTTWRFATAPRAVVDPFARQFGLVVMRDDPTTLTHNLRTALVDRQGRLVRVYNGREWTPEDLVAEIAKVADARPR
jgi:protein SCO1/2